MSTDRTTEILNYLSAISREVGALRTEMQNRFEEVNGRFDEVNGRFEEVNGRFEKVDSRFGEVNSRFDRLEAEMREGFKAVRTDIRLLQRQFDVMAQDLIILRRDHRDHEVRLVALEPKQL
jgi:predicted nuclease with TOPRIM domain